MTTGDRGGGVDQALPLLSICIPSFNRPEALSELLESVDARPSEVEIVVAEDCSPRRAEVREVVHRFAGSAPYAVRYSENPVNLGYDRNLRELIGQARGEFVMFMGDDDKFVPGGLTRFLAFLHDNRDLAYVLRSYCSVHDDGRTEYFRYWPASRRFAPGVDAYVALFRRSVVIAGFTFKRESAAPFLSARFDGTLLYQLYLMAELTLRYPSAYCDVPVAIVAQTYRLDKPQFGSARAEAGRFEQGKVTVRNSLNFMKGFFEISSYIDRQHGLASTETIRRTLSKYSYPILSIQRKRGAREFTRYVRLLNKEVGINRTPHYYLYAAGLLVLGERVCDRMILRAKRLLGHTPEL